MLKFRINLKLQTCYLFNQLVRKNRFKQWEILIKICYHNFMQMTQWKIQGMERELSHYAIDSQIQPIQLLMQTEAPSLHQQLKKQKKTKKHTITKNYFNDKSQNSIKYYAKLADQLFRGSALSDDYSSESILLGIDKQQFTNFLFYKKDGSFECQYLKSRELSPAIAFICPCNKRQKYQVFFLAQNGLISRKISNVKIKKQKQDVKQKISNYMRKKNVINFVMFTTQKILPEDVKVFFQQRKSYAKIVSHQDEEDDSAEVQQQKINKQQQQQRIVTIINLQQHHMIPDNFNINCKFLNYKTKTFWNDLPNLKLYIKQDKDIIILSNKNISPEHLINLKMHYYQFFTRKIFIWSELFTKILDKGRMYYENQYLSGLFALSYNWMLINKKLHCQKSEIQSIKSSLINKFHQDLKNHKIKIKKRRINSKHHYPQKSKCKCCLVCKRENKYDQEENMKKTSIRKSGYKCQGCSNKFGFDVVLCLNQCFGKFHQDLSYYMPDMSGNLQNLYSMTSTKDLDEEQIPKIRQSQQILQFWNQQKNRIVDRVSNFYANSQKNYQKSELQKIVDLNQALLKYSLDHMNTQIKRQANLG